MADTIIHLKAKILKYKGNGRMVQYKSKKELIDAINNSYHLFAAEFNDIKNENMHKRIAAVDKTPAEMITYQIGWLNHVMQYEKDELAGKTVITPAPSLKWNELGKLVQTLILSRLLQTFGHKLKSGKN